MSENQIVGYVDATFGKKLVRFELYRDADTLARLEQAVGSVNAAWGRFILGNWTVSDMRAVLAAAHPAVAVEHGSSLYHGLQRVQPAKSLTERIAEITGGQAPPRAVAPLRPVGGVPAAVIDAVTGRHPVATYAPLAEKILQALIVGLPAAVATFDERTALDAARAVQMAPAEPSEAAA